MTGPADDGPLLSPGYWLHRAALVWRAALEVRLRPLGLTPTQFVVLASTGWLEGRSGPPTQQEVADRAGADRMMTSKVAQALEARGLLERRPHESDARARRLALTAAGRAAAARGAAVARDLDGTLFGDDAADLRDRLRALVPVAEDRGTKRSSVGERTRSVGPPG